MSATKCFFTMLVVLIVGIALGATMGYSYKDYDRVASAYGCGRHDAMQTASSDPAEYDLPPCVEIRKIWLWGERWPK